MPDCPFCAGKGFIFELSYNWNKWGSQVNKKRKCIRCNGVGQISQEYFNRIQEGKRLRRLRLEYNMDAREIVKILGIPWDKYLEYEYGRGIDKKIVKKLDQMYEIMEECRR